MSGGHVLIGSITAQTFFIKVRLLSHVLLNESVQALVMSCCCCLLLILWLSLSHCSEKSCGQPIIN